MSNDIFKPSDFSNIGIPCCSIWGKCEIEYLAWAYVTALTNDGDIWGKTLTAQQCYNLLSKDQKDFVRPFLSNVVEYNSYKEYWADIQKRLISSDGALEVGGLAWNEYKIEKYKENNIK